MLQQTFSYLRLIALPMILLRIEEKIGNMGFKMPKGIFIRTVGQTSLPLHNHREGCPVLK